MIFFSPIWLLLLLPLAAAMYLWRLPTRGLNLVRFIIILLLVLTMAPVSYTHLRAHET